MGPRLPRGQLVLGSPSGLVGIDLGGTKIFGARVAAPRVDAVEVCDTAKRPTPTGGVDEIVDEICAVVRSLTDQPRLVGIGAPGVIDTASGVVAVAPNLPGFDRPVPLAALVSEQIGCPVVIGNDVNVAAYAETRVGAAAGHDDVLAVWMGTGLGAGFVFDGRLRVGPNGMAGELGHIVVEPGGRQCGCGGRGHLEAYIGRRSLEARARALHAEGRRTALVDKAGAKPIKSKAFRAAYDDGDPVAVELIEDGLSRLGVAIANVVVTVDLSAVVIGGGLGERLGHVASDWIETALRSLRFAGVSPEVLLASLGDPSGAIGAALLAVDAHGGS